MKLEIASLVPKSKVVLDQFGLGGVKRHLVTGQPACVAQNSGGMHDRALEVHVAGQVDVVALVAGLQLATLLAMMKIRGYIYQLRGS